MEKQHDTRLTSAEMAGLWGQYINDSATICILDVFLTKVEDENIRTVMETGLQFSKEHIEAISKIFKGAQLPIPIGFTEEDINREAPRLFSDIYFLQYIRHMTVLQMAANTLAIGLGTRLDIIEFHEKVLNETVQLQEMTKKVQLEKGIYIRPPYIPTPDNVEFVSEQRFLGNVMGKQRPLTVIEISHLFLNLQTCLVGKEMMMGFAQVANSQELKDYFLRGKQLAHRHMKDINQFLLRNDLPATMPWDSAVTDSQTSPFSEKLMLFLVTGLGAAGMARFSAGMGASPRKDVALKYARFLAEVTFYAEDGANLVVDKGWLEEPPQALDRKRLAEE